MASEGAANNLMRVTRTSALPLLSIAPRENAERLPFFLRRASISSKESSPLRALILRFASNLATEFPTPTTIQDPPSFSTATKQTAAMQFGITFIFLLMTYGATADDTCPPTEVVKLAGLYSNPHLHPCQKVSAGFSMTPPTNYPTDQQAKAMCASEACRALIKDVLALKPADCYLSVAGVKLNAYKLACSFEEKCKAEKDHEDGKYHPTPKPTHNKYSPTPKPTEDGKYCLTEDDKHDPTPKPTNDKHPTPKPTGDHLYLAEPKIVKIDDKNKPRPAPTKEADQMKPPMNGTALELLPLPNTTYKAKVPKTSAKA